MGITHLAKLLAERAPGAIKEHEMKLYFGRKVLICSFKRVSNI